MSELSQNEIVLQYCPHLHENVTVMCARNDDDLRKSFCLSSHLCHTEERIRCQKRGMHPLPYERFQTENTYF